MIGSVVGSYRITEKIGEGGMGAVYKAVHTKMDRVCAIKLLHPSYMEDESSVARFNREAKMASRIDSPHAVTIYDFGEAQGGLLYLAMEYIEGKTLRSVLASESPLETGRAVHIACQVSAALSAAHSFGVVHRDLKPDNIMITSKGGETDYVKVLDFGIAKTFADSESDTLTGTGLVLGTPMYMSPEQVSGQKLDERSDIYSLALITYQMLSAKLPFEGENPQAIMIGRITSNPIPLRSVVPAASESIERAVMAGLARDRGTRTRTAVDFASQLTAAIPAHTRANAAADTVISANYVTEVARAVPDTRSIVPHGEQITQQSSGVIENRLTAQAWLYNKLTWKTYAGALASVVIAVAVALPFYTSKSGGDASTVSAPSAPTPSSAAAPALSVSSGEPQKLVAKPDASKATRDQAAASARTLVQKPAASESGGNNSREEKTSNSAFYMRASKITSVRRRSPVAPRSESVQAKSVRAKRKASAAKVREPRSYTIKTGLVTPEKNQ